jgi:hypothetical protein
MHQRTFTTKSAQSGHLQSKQWISEICRFNEPTIRRRMSVFGRSKQAPLAAKVFVKLHQLIYKRSCRSRPPVDVG